MRVLVGKGSQVDMVVKECGVRLMNQLFVHLHILHPGAVLQPKPVKKLQGKSLAFVVGFDSFVWSVDGKRHGSVLRGADDFCWASAGLAVSTYYFIHPQALCAHIQRRI